MLMLAHHLKFECVITVCVLWGGYIVHINVML